MDTVSLLRSVPVFSALNEEVLSTIAGFLREARLSAGSVIFRQGQTADAFFIISSGEVTISRKFGSHEKTLAVLGPGSVFGEMAFFADSPRTADAAATRETTAYRLDRGDFLRFVNDQPKAGLQVLSGLLQVGMQRLEQTSRELATVYETGKVISAGTTIAAIARGVLDQLLLAIPEADEGAVFIYNEYNEEFDPAAAPAGTAAIAKDAPAVGLIREKNCGFTMGGDERTLAFRTDFASAARELLLAPAHKDGNLFGFFVLWNASRSDAFTGSHCLLVSAVGTQLAEAAENIKYRQEERDRRQLDSRRQEY